MKVNKKKLLALGVGIFAVALVTAGLVNYLSNTANVNVEVSSPMEIVFPEGFESSLELYGGDSVAIDSVTINRASVPIENILIEVKVLDFDGVGITYFHHDDTWEGDIPVCTAVDDVDAYYYIGPAGGFTAEVGYNMEATSTITADTTLEPRLYETEIKVITASSKAC